MSIICYLFLLYFLLVTPKAFVDSEETAAGDNSITSDNSASVDNSDNADNSRPTAATNTKSSKPTMQPPNDHAPYEGPPDFEFGKELIISGQAVQNVIVGSRPKYKILASIRVADTYNTGNYSHRCLGVLVTNAVVVTVAHCLHDQFGNFILKPATYRVALGNNMLAESSKTIPVSKVKYHKNYLIENKINDIALLKLAKPQSVLTPDLYYLRPENQPNTTDCTIYSWVFSQEEGMKTMAFSSWNVKIQHKSDCYLEMGASQSYLSPFHKCFLIPDTMRCACVYNPGAPILCQDILVGLYSYSATAQQNEVLGQLAVYVNVGNYIDFIERFINPGKASTLKCSWTMCLVIIAIFIL